MSDKNSRNENKMPNTLSPKTKSNKILDKMSDKNNSEKLSAKIDDGAFYNIIVSAEEGYLEKVKDILGDKESSAHIDISNKDRCDMTPLHFAAEKGVYICIYTY